MSAIGCKGSGPSIERIEHLDRDFFESRGKSRTHPVHAIMMFEYSKAKQVKRQRFGGWRPTGNRWASNWAQRHQSSHNARPEHLFVIVQMGKDSGSAKNATMR